MRPVMRCLDPCVDMRLRNWVLTWSLSAVFEVQLHGVRGVGANAQGSQMLQHLLP